MCWGNVVISVCCLCVKSSDSAICAGEMLLSALFAVRVLAICAGKMLLSALFAVRVLAICAGEMLLSALFAVRVLAICVTKPRLHKTIIKLKQKQSFEQQS